MTFHTQLRIPGPTPLPERVVRSMSRPMIDHRGTEFAAILSEITAGAKRVFKTKNDLLLLTSSGTGGLESAVANLVSQGDEVVVALCGNFGERFAALAAAYGADVVRLEFEWGQPVDPDDLAVVLERHPKAQVVLLTHNETSTGLTNPLRDLARVARDAGRLVVVDGVSSISSIEIETDAWGIDVAVSGSQKGWMAPPGLALVSVSEHAWAQQANAHSPRFYFDWKEAKTWAQKGMTPFTPAVPVAYALQEGLRMLEEEGLNNVYERHARLARATQAGLVALGFQLYAQEGFRSHTVTSAVPPPGLDVAALRTLIDTKYGVVIAGGQGKMTGKMVRVGHLGALAVRSETRVTAPIIEAGRKLRVVGRAGVGVDNIDVQAATRKGILVVNAPRGNIVAAAEHAMALLFALARWVPQADASVKRGEWNRSKFIGTEIRGKTLGVIGLGNVGSEVAKRAHGLEMDVIAYDPVVSVERAELFNVALVSLNDLLERADFVTVHVPLVDSNRNLIGGPQLALMKPTARLINTARGGIVDEAALCEALQEGRLTAAAADVFATEPPGDNPLLKLSNFIATPHIGASTLEAQVSVAFDVAEEVAAVLAGDLPRFAVNAPALPPEELAYLRPFAELTERLAALHAQLYGGRVGTIELDFEGELAEHDVNLLVASAIKGVVQPFTEERINAVNARLIAANRGIRLVERQRDDDPGGRRPGRARCLVAAARGRGDVGSALCRTAPTLRRLTSALCRASGTTWHGRAIRASWWRHRTTFCRIQTSPTIAPCRSTTSCI